jgi:glycosyltransferase involved in cell wall biosynthesis
MTNTDSVAVLPPEARRFEIPYMVVLWLIGAIQHEEYKAGDGCALELDEQFYPLSKPDFDLVKEVATKLEGEMPQRMVTPEDWMFAHKRATQILKDFNIEVPGKKVAMLKDRGGAGYWRMVLPSLYLNACVEEIQIDVTAAEVKFDYLLEYDTIMVQRTHDWDSYYTLEKLKKAGRRIVYDIDDDLFSLTPDNPAYHSLTKDAQEAALACMRLADVVTTTTPILADRLAQVMDTGVCPVVIPNALDTDDNWLPTLKTGSPDGYKRIFWQGSATHEEDWSVCIGAVDRIMRTNPKVRLVLLGYLPQVVIAHLNEPHWKGRVEHFGFSDSETYFQLIKHVRAEVGIAPLAPKTFNESKSPIKWLEYTCIGMPTVASDMEPYNRVIEDGVSGYLANTEDEWVLYLSHCLNDAVVREKMIKESREEAAECYDIKKVVASWQEVLLP